ncbi:hypothetical protein F5B22DRAFT_647934 [Xylaria bambusicola]|uniref:uncharacterized protein n=1 Tax=Xylaria bambusicola TaxID=326684 RepID=UPI0020086DAB|nr:uncharacterized protein F5B22DRAFT_647934 [Xylaria bambusicola]KAI0513120.1 hypothetical protein F5B22DRAFT_647934 [Xylaria bambusicola]
MPTENTNASRAFDYGVGVTGENVDFAEESGLEAPGVHDKALLDRLRDALKPGDARKAASSSSSADTTHDGRHGGVEEIMKPGHRDYDEGAHHGLGGAASGILGQTRSGFEQMKAGEGELGLMDAIKRKTGAAQSEDHRDSSRLTKADNSKAPGGVYQAIRDEFKK